MPDNRLDQENVLTDFDYAIIVKGTDVAKISKADLAKVVGGLIPEASASQKGLMSAEYRRRKWYIPCPILKSSAVKIARIKKTAGYFGASLSIRANMFQASSDIFLVANVANGTYNFNCKHVTCAWSSANFDVIISGADSYYDVYVTGSFSSSYDQADIEVSTASDKIEPVEEYSNVSVGSISVHKKFTIQ